MIEYDLAELFGLWLQGFVVGGLLSGIGAIVGYAVNALLHISERV